MATDLSPEAVALAGENARRARPRRRRRARAICSRPSRGRSTSSRATRRTCRPSVATTCRPRCSPTRRSRCSADHRSTLGSSPRRRRGCGRAATWSWRSRNRPAPTIERLAVEAGFADVRTVRGPERARPRGHRAAAVTATPLDEAVAAARRGALIVFPTDTVYGVGTRPDDPAATAARVRGEGPAARTSPCRCSSPRRARRGGSRRSMTRADVARRRRAGPARSRSSLPRTDAAAGFDLGGDAATIGVRVPDHPLALAVLARTGPLAVTSANRSGRAARHARATSSWPRSATRSPSTSARTSRIEGGRSTVLDLAHGPARMLRAGDVTADRLARLLPGEGPLLDSPPFLTWPPILVVCTGNVCRSPSAEGLLRRAFDDRLGAGAVAVTSAGTAGWEGSPPTAGVDRRDRRARRRHRRAPRPRPDGRPDRRRRPGARDGARAPRGGARPRPRRRTAHVHDEGARSPPRRRRRRGARPAVARRDRGAGARTRRHGQPVDDDVADPLGMPLDTYRAMAASSTGSPVVSPGRWPIAGAGVAP